MIHPTIVSAARHAVEKQAASLGELVARGGAAAGKGLGTVLGGQAGNIARHTPAALGTALGAYVGSKRPDLGGDEAPTRGQRIRGAVAGGLIGGTVGRASGLGASMAEGLASRAATTGLTGSAATTRALEELGQGAGKYIAGTPGRVGAAIASGAKTVGRTVTNPIETVENVAQAAWDPLKTAIRQPGSVGQYLKGELSHPIGAGFMGLSALDAAQNLRTTEDPMTGRHRGLGERVLGSAGNLAGGLAYGAYQGPASANNPITRVAGSIIGGSVVGRGASSLGRKIDALTSRPAPAPVQQGAPA